MHHADRRSRRVRLISPMQSAIAPVRRSLISTYVMLGVLAGTFALGSSAGAATLNWDTSVAGGGISGGNGIWNTTNTNWTADGGASKISWTDGNNAKFDTGTGTVTLGENISVSSIEFWTTGYTIDSPSYTLTIDAGGTDSSGGPRDVRLTSSHSATINAPIIVLGETNFALSQAPGTLTVNGTISGAGSINKDGTGTLTLNNSNTSTGISGFSFKLSGGTLEVGDNSALGQSAFQWFNDTEIRAIGGSRTIANNISITSNSNARTVGGSQDITFTGDMSTSGLAGKTLNITNTGVTTFSGVISGAGLGFTKTGNGLLVYSGNNTYTGATTLSAGTLLINGSTTGQGSYNVNSGGTLGGTGTIGLAAGQSVLVADGGTIAPGASIGTLTVTGDTTINGTLAIELGDSTSDMLSVSGLLTLGGTSEIDFTTLATPTAGSYILASYDTLSGTFANVSDLPTSYEIDYNYENQNQIALVLVPEPGALALIAIGLPLVFSRRKES